MTLLKAKVRCQMSVAEKAELADVVPPEWKDQYQDIQLTKGRDGHDYLYGVDESGHKGSRLNWEVLDKYMEQTYGIEPEAPYPGLRSENQSLRQKNIELKRQLDDLKMDMAAMEVRLNSKIGELEAKIDRQPAVFDPDTFQKVREWRPKT